MPAKDRPQPHPPSGFARSVAQTSPIHTGSPSRQWLKSPPRSPWVNAVAVRIFTTAPRVREDKRAGSQRQDRSRRDTRPAVRLRFGRRVHPTAANMSLHLCRINHNRQPIAGRRTGGFRHLRRTRWRPASREPASRPGSNTPRWRRPTSQLALRRPSQRLAGALAGRRQPRGAGQSPQIRRSPRRHSDHFPRGSTGMPSEACEDTLDDDPADPAIMGIHASKILGRPAPSTRVRKASPVFLRRPIRLGVGCPGSRTASPEGRRAACVFNDS